jgi:hypothetical protein
MSPATWRGVVANREIAPIPRPQYITRLGEDGAGLLPIVAGGWAGGCDRLQDCAREDAKMTSYAESDLRQSSKAEANAVRTERRMRLARAFMMAAILAMVALAIIVEARMTAEERAALFDAYYQ